MMAGPRPEPVPVAPPATEESEAATDDTKYAKFYECNFLSTPNMLRLLICVKEKPFSVETITFFVID
jgi:hypothetical protein